MKEFDIPQKHKKVAQALDKKRDAAIKRISFAKHLLLESLNDLSDSEHEIISFINDIGDVGEWENMRFEIDKMKVILS